MATTQLELLRLNKGRAKRGLSAGVFTMQMEMPGGVALEDGAHIIGRIEGNIAITRVVLGRSTAFNGTDPIITLSDNLGNTYFSAEEIDVTGILESDKTANGDDGQGNPTFENPIYSPGVVEFTADIDIDGSTDGRLYFVVDYVQLDTVTGKHTK